MNGTNGTAATERTPLLRPEAGQEIGKDAETVPIPSWRRTVGIVLALVGVFIAGADQSFLMVTYETIAAHFDAVSDNAWILTGYNLGYCIALPVYGKFSDAHGQKTPLAISYCLFSIGILLSGAGLHVWQVIAGRVVTGLGGAGMVALISVIITENAPPNQVALIRSFVNVINVSGRAFGGPLGAFIADAVGWRWSFFVQAPTTLFCGITFMLLWTNSQPVAQKNPDSSSEQGSDQTKRDPSSKKVDYFGILGFSVTVTSLLAAIELFGKDDKQLAYILLGVALAFGLIFMLIETYHAEQPLVPLSLLKTTTSIYFLVQISLAFGRQAHVSSLSPYFLWTQDIDLTEAAVRLIPSPIGFTLGSIVAGTIIQRTNRYRALWIVSTIIGVLFYLLITIRWGADRQFPLEWLYSLPAGLAQGAVLSCAFTGLTVSGNSSQQGTIICLYYLCQQFGGIIGTAISTAGLHKMFESTLLVALKDVPHKEKVVRHILNKSGLLSVPASLRVAVRLSYLSSFQLISVFPIVATALTLPLVIFSPKGEMG